MTNGYKMYIIGFRNPVPELPARWRLYRIDQPDDDKPVVTGGTSLSNTRRKLSELIFCILASRRMLYVDVVNFQCTIIVI